jgi:hypothetical protein
MICYGRHAPRALAHSITMWSEKNQGKIYVNKTKNIPTRTYGRR